MASEKSQSGQSRPPQVLSKGRRVPQELLSIVPSSFVPLEH